MSHHLVSTRLPSRRVEAAQIFPNPKTVNRRSLQVFQVCVFRLNTESTSIMIGIANSFVLGKLVHTGFQAPALSEFNLEFPRCMLVSAELQKH